MTKFICGVCGYEYERPKKPKACPNCGAKLKDELLMEKLRFLLGVNKPLIKDK